MSDVMVIAPVADNVIGEMSGASPSGGASTKSTREE